MRPIAADSHCFPSTRRYAYHKGLALLIAVAAMYCAAGQRTVGVVADVQMPERMVRTARGTTLFDFGKAAFGGVEVDFAKGGYEVRIGEKLDAQGCVDMKPGGTIRAAAVRGVSRGGGFERVPLVADEREFHGDGPRVRREGRTLVIRSM